MEQKSEILADVSAKVKEFLAEGQVATELVLEGVLNRVYRLEAFLNKAVTYVPRYDSDGHPLPLRDWIEAELRLKSVNSGHETAQDKA